MKFIEGHIGEIDMLITDQTMPDISGIELAKAALKIKKTFRSFCVPDTAAK